MSSTTKKTLLTSGVILVLLIAAHLGIRWTENKIRHEIDSLSFISFETIDVNVLRKSVSLSKVEGQKKGFQGKVDLLQVKGLNLFSIIRNDGFFVEEVLVDGLAIEYRRKDQKSEIDSTQSTREEDLPKISIENLELKNSIFKLFEDEKLIFSTKIAAVFSELTDDEISSPREIPGRLEQMTLDTPKFHTPDGYYEIAAKQIALNSDLLRVFDVAITCKKEKYELGNIVGHEIDWFDASVDSITMKISDLGSLLKQPEIAKIKIHSPTLTVFRDKRLPFPENRRPPLVRDLLSNNEFSFALDTIEFMDGKITYQQFVKEEKGSGMISFERLNATITDLTSYTFERKKNPRLLANCALYGEAKLFADITFPGNRNAKQTLVKGKVMSMDLTIFNKMISYVSVLELKSGQSDNLEFEFSYNDTLSAGDMKFVYEDLAVAFLEKQESEPDGVLNKVKGFLVNNLVIDKSNNLESNKFRVGKIKFKRDERKSVFNYWWGSILVGFKSSTGVDTSGEKIDVN